MTLHVEENYAFGIPFSTVAGWTPTGVACHWSAGGPGRGGWNGTVQHLINTRLSTNASYHGGFWCEHEPAHQACRTIIQWIVPTTKAAHSIAPSQVFKYNPNKDRGLQDARFAEVRRILGAKAADPNAGCLAIAYAGMPENLAQDVACPVFRADIQNLGRQLVAHPAVIDDRPHFGHGWIQPIDRYEMDAPGVDLIALLYATEPTVPDAPIEGEDTMREDTKGFVSLVGQRAKFTADLTARSRPRFDPTDYDAYYVGHRDGESEGIAIGWVEGTNVTLNDGTVLHASTRWLISGSQQNGIWFVHEANVANAAELTGPAAPPPPVDPNPELKRQLDRARAALTTIETAAIEGRT